MTNNCTIIKIMPKDNRYGSAVTHGFPIFKHWHADMEFIYVETGKLEIGLDDDLYEVEKGMIMIVGPDTFHTFMSTEPESVIWVARIYLSDMQGYFGVQEHLSDIYRNSLLIKATGKMAQIMKELVSADYGILNEYYTVIKASELTVELLSRKANIKKYIRTQTVESSESIVKMQQFIENSLHKEITLPMVAEYLGFSTSYCSKYIKKKTNQNFLDYVNSIRVREAETLLRTGNMCITDISYATGFNSIQSFNRIFKKYRGVTPTEYRKSLRNKK